MPPSAPLMSAWSPWAPVMCGSPVRAAHAARLYPKSGRGRLRGCHHLSVKEVAGTAAVGQTLLEVAHENDIDLEGACDGSLACSTCHVVLEQEYFDMLPEPEEEEEDMLDLAFGLTDTSRLGCQIKLTKELEGIRATIPGGADNMLPPKG